MSWKPTQPMKTNKVMMLRLMMRTTAADHETMTMMLTMPMPMTMIRRMRMRMRMRIIIMQGGGLHCLDCCT